MPTGTFFRLPEEKQRRLMEAAWEEFVRTSYTEVSINKIIQIAGIPRGSFYQYFEGKEDLFFYLLDDVHRHFIQVFCKLLDRAGGDLFQMHLLAYDDLVQWGDNQDPSICRCIQFMRVNPGMDFLQTMSKEPEFLPEELYQKIDVRRFRKKDRMFVESVFSLTVMSLVSAMVEALTHPGETERQRRRLEERIKILEYGSLDSRPEAARTQQGGIQA
ncbi:MAG: TetR/AcrR family transcriptional regulator [Clostridiales bacterium]|jgi:AcrR family transcriptional regulator|nr:TetR/AcrR family transcriptional regulator [Clostridiales bacterium]BDE86072.1 hypothetical protein CE91St42_05300 [Oscillospiraceae bacterium]CUQ00367.1 TetR family transcriptional regulator [Flavonifractor plautii]SCJ34922.1 HTH-type transcriptional repressor fabR [uncultured Flavonifractor sp.]